MVTLLTAAEQSAGAYGLPEAARYLRMPVQTLRRWFIGDAKNAPLHRAGIQEGETYLLTFEDYIEAAAVRCLRHEHGLSLQKIRSGYEKARDLYGIDRLFNRRSHRVFASSAKELLICIEEEDSVNPTQLTGKIVGQKEFHVLAQAYLRQIEWDEDGLARLWVASKWGEARVVLRPDWAFGEPVLERSGYRAETLYHAFMAEGDIAQVARLYDVTEEEVDAACNFMTALVPEAA